MNIQRLLQHSSVTPYLFKARYGIEKESQRVDLNGELAKTPHPTTLGSRTQHPYIQTDFAETQMELITPVAESIPEVLRILAGLHDVAYRSLDDEMLWPLSMPPALPTKDEDIIIAKLANFEDVLYRRYLAKTYGKRKQMVSGIHFNFEFSDELLRAIFALQTEETDYQAFKTAVYLKVTRGYLHYRWLITYFYGAAPASEAGFFTPDEIPPTHAVRSLRNSEYGYKNHDDVAVSYASLSAYLDDIQQMVETGRLSEEKEFYAPVRLRGGKRVADLAQAGIRYIELRNIDLNPFAPYGIDEHQITFLHLFLLHLLWREDLPSDDAWVQQGDTLNNIVALEEACMPTAYAGEARAILRSMEDMVAVLNLHVPETLFSQLWTMIEQPETTLAGRLVQESQQSSQATVATALSAEQYRRAWAHPYQLAGFETMELSTQILLFDAFQAGVSVEILDEHDQFLKLTYAGRSEYVKNANMTSKDTYIVPLLMENKIVTKKVLSQAHFAVPKGGEYATPEAAIAAFAEYATRGFVVKPKSTNYGLGISIFKDGASLADYTTAVALAFAEDDVILVEEFIAGTEYRFFVVEDQVRGIILRKPANIIGDGVHTIAELVATKNEDPLRGTHHRYPLEKIQLGELEQLMLKTQGYVMDDIPAQDQIVYLRENSNVSTGGDSIDMTDVVGEDYKDIAVAAVQAIGAQVCGIDLIIPDYTQPASAPDAYSIIEANFNPAMAMHIYPYQGKSRRLTKDILRLLYPELKKDTV